jgi:hypothetical protein
MNIRDLKDAHAAAGVTYAGAIERLRAAFVELAALELALISQNGGRPDAAPTFGQLPQNPGPFEHPIFAKVNPATCWRDQVAARRESLLKALEKGA